MTRPVNTILAISIVVAITAVIGGVIWWQFSQQAEEIAPASEQTSQQQEIQQNNQQQSELAGWKTYTNTEYGFEFRYPDAWPQPTMGAGFLSGGLPQEKSKWSLQVGIVGKGPCEGADCAQYELTGYSYSDYNSFLVSLNKNQFISGIKEIDINGLKTIYYLESGLREDQTYMIFGPTQSLKFVNVWGEKNIFNQILPTFKFTK